MTLQQLSNTLDLPLSATLARFGENKSLFLRCLKEFPNDPDWSQLQQAYKQNDFEAIERTAHTLKGVSVNLGLDVFSQACHHIVTAIRQKNYDSLPTLMDEAQRCYEKVCTAIIQLDDAE